MVYFRSYWSHLDISTTICPHQMASMGSNSRPLGSESWPLLTVPSVRTMPFIAKPFLSVKRLRCDQSDVKQPNHFFSFQHNIDNIMLINLHATEKLLNSWSMVTGLTRKSLAICILMAKMMTAVVMECNSFYLISTEIIVFIDYLVSDMKTHWSDGT